MNSGTFITERRCEVGPITVLSLRSTVSLTSTESNAITTMRTSTKKTVPSGRAKYVYLEYCRWRYWSFCSLSNSHHYHVIEKALHRILIR